ncbi:MAG: PHP domain-containing protein [Corynebacteriales bacterium]|nr:PHP domain-containing protein [Mycobacteriales bacterium]
MRIDLHVHSTASDGTVSPAALMTQAHKVGLNVIALTDHDTTAGWDEAITAIPKGLTLVPGLELSCRWNSPHEPYPISLHILAYLFDRDEPTFRHARLRLRESRAARGAKIVELLQEGGLDITWDEVLGYADGAPVGRPHIGKALIARGLVKDMNGAFASSWLGARYRVEKADIPVFDALRLIQRAGGVSVFAHPKADKRGKVVPESVIAELAAAGLTGIEADHADHDAHQRARLHELAAELGLVVTGSSDYHGSHKPIQLGENATTTVAAYEKLVSAATGSVPIVG